MQSNQGRSPIVRAAAWLVAVAAIGASLYAIVKAGEKQSAPAASPAAATADDWQRGASTAAVTLIEYADPQCPACAQYQPMLNELFEQYGDRVNFVYRHFPLQQLHANAQLASRAAEAAGSQGNIWGMLDLLYGEQPAWSNLDQGAAREQFTGYAEQLDFDVERFNADLDSSEVADAVDADAASGRAAKITGTPSFFLNGERLANPRSTEDFAKAIEAALNQSGGQS